MGLAFRAWNHKRGFRVSLLVGAREAEVAFNCHGSPVPEAFLVALRRAARVLSETPGAASWSDEFGTVLVPAPQLNGSECVAFFECELREWRRARLEAELDALRGLEQVFDEDGDGGSAWDVRRRMLAVSESLSSPDCPWPKSPA